MAKVEVVGSTGAIETEFDTAGITETRMLRADLGKLERLLRLERALQRYKAALLNGRRLQQELSVLADENSEAVQRRPLFPQ